MASPENTTTIHATTALITTVPLFLTAKVQLARWDFDQLYGKLGTTPRYCDRWLLKTCLMGQDTVDRAIGLTSLSIASSRISRLHFAPFTHKFSVFSHPQATTNWTEIAIHQPVDPVTSLIHTENLLPNTLISSPWVWQPASLVSPLNSFHSFSI